MEFVDQKGYSPYVKDTTRSWIETMRRASGKNGLVQPNLLLRYATDTNYIRNGKMDLYGTGKRDARTRAMMNLALPCQRLFGPINWTVQETMDNIVQSASVELINALPVSQTATTLRIGLNGEYHSDKVRYNHMMTSMGTVKRIDGNSNMGNITLGTNIKPGTGAAATAVDPWGYKYQEKDVKFREFGYQYVELTNGTNFPDPAIRTDDIDNDTDNSYWPTTATGMGGYFVLIGNTEVVRVIRKEDIGGNIRLWIPPGGRAINGKIRNHIAGDSVSLLGIGPFRAGDFCGMGYMNLDDYAPQKCLVRPGTCLVSYEGYGDFALPLTHDYDRGRNYQFTGYWFVNGVEPSIGVDGVPKIRLDLRSAGHLYDTQKITPDILRRMKTQFGQWRVGEKNLTIWGDAEHKRDIPGDWVDYNSWEPGLKDSYPMKISIELAQHKEFFNHMREKNMGAACEICRAEQREWIKTHGVDPANPVMRERGTGRHIYKQSIRVMQESAGPIKTYIRLMATICCASWDHPAYGTELAQRFTKIPNTLFENMRNIYTGLIYNGRFDFSLKNKKLIDLTEPTYDNNDIIMRRVPLLSPFESTYDRAPFSQPMQDLAQVNNMTFWVSREGYPVFKPRLDDLRPSGFGHKTYAGWKADNNKLAWQPSEWYMNYGGSLDSYSNSVNPESVITQAWVTATTVFDSTFTIACAGTGWTTRSHEDKEQMRVNYSPLAGNKDGLALTSGVQQVETMALDNLQLGFSWDSHPPNWGAKTEVDGEGDRVLNTLPAFPNTGFPELTKDISDTKYRQEILRLQALINFFLIRHYIEPLTGDAGRKWWQIEEDGKFGSLTKTGLEAVQTEVGHTPVNGVWDRDTADDIRAYLNTNKHYIKFDIWWYVINGREWEEYLAAITGIPIPLKAVKGVSRAKAGSRRSVQVPRWIPDQQGMMKKIEDWHKNFSAMAVNAGNAMVDQSIDRATARSISSPTADPRIQPGDVIWCEVPGHLGSRDDKDKEKPPFNNGIYVTNISRQMDLSQKTYTMTASGHRFRGQFGQGVPNLQAGYKFIDNDRKQKA